MLARKSDFAGICPACGLAVYQSEPDGPVWTCRYDLSPKNPYYEDIPDDWKRTEAQMEKDGYFANCPEWLQGWCPSNDGGPGHMPLHSECYDKGDY